jgi:hypothetical protein
MRSTFLIPVLLILAFSVAFGQTNTEKALFVEKALNRISKKTTDREAELIVQRERLRGMDEQSRRKLENAVIERAKAEQTLSDLVRLKKELELASPPVALASLERLKTESNQANEQLDKMKAREIKARNEAKESRHALNQQELELRNVSSRNAAITTELKTLNRVWRSRFVSDDFTKLKAAIIAAAKELALKSSAVITSQDSSGKESAGARVRFQGDEERRNGATPRYSGLTNCRENNLDIGWYFFWSERKDPATSVTRATSDINYGKFIIDPVEKVPLLEDH